MKRNTTLSIEEDIVNKAKSKNINLSLVAEQALKDSLGIVEVDTSIDKCEFCGKEMEIATSKDPDHFLTWLFPDEKWICPMCLRSKCNEVINGKH